MSMKKVALVFVVLFSVAFGVYAQSGKIKGVVQYKYNDHIGYKIDVGAEIYVVSKSNAPEFNISKWDEYEKTALASIKFWEYLGEPAASFHPLDAYCNKDYQKMSQLFEDVALVDASGKYELELPYGEYFVFVKSKNRTRSFSQTEKNGRILVKQIRVEKPVALLSFDFDY